MRLNQNKNNFSVMYVQAFALRQITNGRASVSPPASVQRVTQSQQSERRLMLGEAQRERSNSTPSPSPRTEGSDGTGTKAGSLWAPVQEALLSAPVLLLQTCLLTSSSTALSLLVTLDATLLAHDSIIGIPQCQHRGEDACRAQRC